MPGAALAQSFSGKVTDACTGNGVPVVIKVSYLSGFPTNFEIPTNANGEFNFVLWGYDPQGHWMVRIKNSYPQPYPQNYIISTGGSGNSNLNFTVQILPDIPLSVHACPTGSGDQPWEITTFDNTCETVKIGNCVPNSLLACWDNNWEQMEGLCYTINIIESDETCSSTGETVYTNSWSWEDIRLEAGCACPTHVKATNINQYLTVGEYYVVEITWRCCDAPSQLPSRRNWGHIQFIEELSTPAVDFAWNATSQIEIINSDLPVDGVIPRSTTWPGPELGPLSIGMHLYPSMTGGSIETYRIRVEEVNCENGETLPEGLIYDKTFDAPNGEMPSQFSFLDITIEVPPGTPQPYFYATDTDEKCYKAILFASNVCGTVSASGYFTITDQCTFCLDNEEAEVRYSPGTGVNSNSESLRVLHHQVTPNPSNAIPNLEWSQNAPGGVQIDLLNSNGLILWQWQGEVAHTDNLLPMPMAANWPTGMYYYMIRTGNDAAVGRFVLAK